jgi:hypothetical protein
MKNKLSDLNDHLFAQLERLGDEDLDDTALKREIERGKAIAGIAREVVSNANTVLRAAELQRGGGAETPRFIGIESNAKA